MNVLPRIPWKFENEEHELFVQHEFFVFDEFKDKVFETVSKFDVQWRADSPVKESEHDIWYFRFVVDGDKQAELEKQLAKYDTGNTAFVHLAISDDGSMLVMCPEDGKFAFVEDGIYKTTKDKK